MQGSLFHSDIHNPGFLPSCGSPLPQGLVIFFFFFFNVYLSIWLCQVLVAARRIFVAACGIFSCGMWSLSCVMWDLGLWPGIEPGPPALGAWSLSDWTTREVPGPCRLVHGQGWVLSQGRRGGMEETLFPKWHTSLQLTHLSRDTVTWLNSTANYKAGREQNPDRHLCGQRQRYATEEGENEFCWKAFSLC